jgi:hypothetical protein
MPGATPKYHRVHQVAVGAYNGSIIDCRKCGQSMIVSSVKHAKLMIKLHEKKCSPCKK